MTARQRGQPLIFLAMIVVLWIGARIFAWTGMPPQPRLVVSAQAAPPATRPRRRPVEGVAYPPLARAGFGRPIVSAAGRAAHRSPPAPAIVMGSVVAAVAAPGPAEGRVTAPPAMVANLRESAVTRGADLPPRLGERRWSGDVWALARSGGGMIGAGPGAATYGGNQVGGVLRYRLAPGNPHRPTAYLRASAALNGSGEREAALGLSVRPVAGVPIFVAAEGRVGVLSDRAVVRPGIMAVTEIPPIDLPGKAQAEFYAQAGYVGGAGATPFADAQLRVDRRIVRAGPVELRAGAGAWGGAQRGAARLDVGPGATIGIARGSAAARIGLDWRFRVAGAAKPASGPALTVSAGF